MPEQSPANAQAASEILGCLHELAQYLREAHHLTPDAQEALADLVDELSNALQPDALPAAETAHLAETAVQVAQALSQRHDRTLLAAATDRLEDAALRAEAKVPMATGIVQRLLAALADLGI